jgi:hypothetical protein
MTFTIGWKSRGHVFLCADSAVTTFDDNSSVKSSTSFGEASVNKSGLQVQESGLKLVNLGRAVVALAGDYSAARKILITLADELKHVDDVQTAFATSIKEVMADADARAVSLMLAAPSQPEPLLLAYDSISALDTIHIVEDTVGVSYGSLEYAPREHARSFIGAFMTLDPRAQLPCALGVLQALGVNTNILEQKVGGAFCGVDVDSSSIRWQGDTLYVVHQPGTYWCKQVLTCVRGNAVMIESGITDSTKVLADHLSGGISEHHINDAVNEIREIVVGCKYDYITFLMAGRPISVVVEMQKHHECKHLRFPSGSLEELPGDVPLHFEFQVSKELMQKIASADCGEKTPDSVTRACFFFPYQPVPQNSSIRGMVTPMTQISGALGAAVE